MGLVLRSTKRAAFFGGAIVVVVEDTVPAMATADSSRGDLVEREAALLFDPTGTRGAFVVVMVRALSVVVVDRGVSNDNAALAVLLPMLLRPGRIEALLFRPTPPTDIDTAGTVSWGGGEEAEGAGEAEGSSEALRSNGAAADVRSGLGTFVGSFGVTLVAKVVETERFFSSSVVAFVAATE